MDRIGIACNIKISCSNSRVEVAMALTKKSVGAEVAVEVAAIVPEAANVAVAFSGRGRSCQLQQWR